MKRIGLLGAAHGKADGAAVGHHQRVRGQPDQRPRRDGTLVDKADRAQRAVEQRIAEGSSRSDAVRAIAAAWKLDRRRLWSLAHRDAAEDEAHDLAAYVFGQPRTAGLAQGQPRAGGAEPALRRAGRIVPRHPQPDHDAAVQRRARPPR